MGSQKSSTIQDAVPAAHRLVPDLTALLQPPHPDSDPADHYPDPGDPGHHLYGRGLGADHLDRFHGRHIEQLPPGIVERKADFPAADRLSADRAVRRTYPLQYQGGKPAVQRLVLYL